MKKEKRIFKLIAIVLIAFQMLLFTNKSKAENIGDVKYLERENKGFYSIQKWNGSEWIYVTYSITHYIDNQGIKRIAYCIDPNLKGIGWIKGEFEGYDVSIKELLSNPVLWRVYINGYPYKTPEQMGVETDDDAYLATKMASYAILRNYTVQDVRNLYRAGEDYVENQKLEDIQRRGNKVINAICNLVDLGYNGGQTMEYNDLFQIVKQNEFNKDNKNDKYYSITYNVISKVDNSNYTVNNISGFPEGTYIANSEGISKTDFQSNESFKVMIPKEKIKENISGIIEINGNCKNYPIYYSECNIGNYQNYILCTDEYTRDIKSKAIVDINVNKSSLQIEKIDKDTKLPIQGVKFSAKYEDGTNIGVFETDKKGIIIIENLKPGNIILEEIESKENYVLNKDVINLKIQYDEHKKLKIENEKKKGTIRIIKVDEDNNEIKIPGVKFEIITDDNEIIQELITDENGEAQAPNLPIDKKYIIKEKETAQEYILTDETVTVELSENEIKTITFKNKKIEKPKEEIEEKKEDNEIKTLPRTGKIDTANYYLGASLIGFTIECKMLKKRKNSRKEE